MKIIKLSVALLLFLTLTLAAVFLFSGEFSFAGNFVSAFEGDGNSSRSFTKAICTESNYCEDYEISCENGELLRFNPTGYAVQFPQVWKDSRIFEDVGRI